MATPVDTEGRELAQKINLRLVSLREDLAALQAEVDSIAGEDARIDASILTLTLSGEQIVITTADGTFRGTLFKDP